MNETCKLEYFGGSQMQRQLNFHKNILLGCMNLKIKKVLVKNRIPASSTEFNWMTYSNPNSIMVDRRDLNTLYKYTTFENNK